MGWECDQAASAMFWDGDPTTQSFISVVGLSTPRASRTRPRPSSAPARSLKTAGFKSSRRPDLLDNSTSFEVGGEHTGQGSLNQRVGNKGATNKTNWCLEDEMRRVRILEHRLHQLKQENACMRDAMLNKADELRLERLAQAQRRNQELITALQTAKEGAETKARRTQERVRALQVQLWISQR